MSLRGNKDLQATMETPLELADQHHVSIEIPSSPSDMAVSIEAGSDPLPLAQARGDSQQSQDAMRVRQLEEEVASLRQSLMAQQDDSQRTTSYLRGQARLVLDHQNRAFEAVAQQHEYGICTCNCCHYY